MIRRPPRSTRTDTLFPYTTLFRSQLGQAPSLLSAVPGLSAKRSNRWRRIGYLLVVVLVAFGAWWLGQRGQHGGPGAAATDSAPDAVAPVSEPMPARPQLPAPTLVIDSEAVPVRSEERRVGNECVSTFSSRGSP